MNKNTRERSLLFFGMITAIGFAIVAIILFRLLLYIEPNPQEVTIGGNASEEQLKKYAGYSGTSESSSSQDEDTEIDMSTLELHVTLSNGIMCFYSIGDSYEDCLFDFSNCKDKDQVIEAYSLFVAVIRNEYDFRKKHPSDEPPFPYEWFFYEAYPALDTAYELSIKHF